MSKVVGFSIEIKGQKEIVNSTKLLGLLNTQLILVAGSLAEVYNNAGTAQRSLERMGKSANVTGNALKANFAAFGQGNKVVQSLGKEYKKAKRS